MGEHEERSGDESLRGLAAPGPSKVGTDKAMRARDVSRGDVVPRETSRAVIGAAPPDLPTDRAHSVGSEGSSGSSPVDS